MALDASSLENQASGRAFAVLSGLSMAQHSLKEIAEKIQGRLLGDPTTKITKLASIQGASKGSLVFAESTASLEEALSSPAAAVITGEFVGNMATKKPLIVCKQPKLGFTQAAAMFEEEKAEKGINSSADLHPSVTIGKNVTVGAHSVIGEDVQIGDNTRIGANCVVAPAVAIGTDCRIGQNVSIHSGCTLGNRVVVQSGAVLGSSGFGYVRDAASGRYYQFPQIGTLVIEDDVEIGANCTIDRGALDATVIRRGTKLDNLVHVGHNVEIGENVVIAAQTGISGSSTIGSDVIVGGQVGIADHVNIEDGVILGAQAGIPSKKVIRGKGIVFWGTPARPIREYLKELAILARIAKKGSK
jgi:UDP-3-O-[3-hydroxymyristoyl] glucosamine N-acyltransferase